MASNSNSAVVLRSEAQEDDHRLTNNNIATACKTNDNLAPQNGAYPRGSSDLKSHKQMNYYLQGHLSD
jgi:hypothetical protein